MHFDDPVNQHPAQYYIDNELGSFTLGPDATSPLDLASAYSTVAASGTQLRPHAGDRDPRPERQAADGRRRASPSTPVTTARRTPSRPASPTRWPT